MTEVALPDPQNATLARIPEFLKQSQAVRVYCQETKDLSAAKELRRRLNMFAHYLADREARKQLEGEMRLVEVLIGELIGPAEMGRPKSSQLGNNGDPDLGLVVDVSDIGKTERMRFRALADNKELVEQLVADGVTKRDTILREISGGVVTPATYRCPHCKEVVTLDTLLRD
jgi:hypothetical protein